MAEFSMIYCVDNIIDEKIQADLELEFRDFLWKYGNTSVPYGEQFFGRVIYLEDQIDIGISENINRLVESGKKFIKDTISDQKKVQLFRILANGQLPGMHGAPHQDSDSDDIITMVYYINQFDGAGTKFYNDIGKETKFIKAKRGRAIFFPSVLTHSGQSGIVGWRISLGIMYKIL